MSHCGADILWPNFYAVLGHSGVERISCCQICHTSEGWTYEPRCGERGLGLANIPSHGLLDKIEEMSIRPFRMPYQISCYPDDYYPNIRRCFSIVMYTKSHHIYIKLYGGYGTPWFSLDTKDGRHYILDTLDEYIGKKYWQTVLLALATLPQPIAEALTEYL